VKVSQMCYVFIHQSAMTGSSSLFPYSYILLSFTIKLFFVLYCFTCFDQNFTHIWGYLGFKFLGSLPVVLCCWHVVVAIVKHHIYTVANNHFNTDFCRTSELLSRHFYNITRLSVKIVLVIVAKTTDVQCFRKR
jgi:hypothetical protein